MKKITVLLVAAALAVATPAMAAPYASGIQDLGGGDYSFVLNEDADSVVVNLAGGGTLDLGPQTQGTVSFSGAYESISVSKTAAVGWTQYSADDTSTSFYIPVGVSIDKNPASPGFGTAYISEGATATTGFGRNVTSGIYALNADASEAAHYTGGVDWTALGTSSPFKSTIGPDGHLYVASYSTDTLYEFNGDMSVATEIVGDSNRTAGQYIEGVYVEGTQAGGDRVVYAVNSHYADARRGLIAYDLAGNATATTDDTGTQFIGPDAFAFYPRDVARDSDGDWYMNQYRYSPNQAPAITKFDGSGTIPLGDDAGEILWETDGSYTGAYAIDLNEEAGLIAYGGYYDGFVYIFDTETGALVDSFDAGSRIRELAWDAAGNLITLDSSLEWARFWSPGGYTMATTGADGTFMIVPEPASLALLALGGIAMLRRRR